MPNNGGDYWLVQCVQLGGVVHKLWLRRGECLLFVVGVAVVGPRPREAAGGRWQAGNVPAQVLGFGRRAAPRLFAGLNLSFELNTFGLIDRNGMGIEQKPCPNRRRMKKRAARSSSSFFFRSLCFSVVKRTTKIYGNLNLKFMQRIKWKNVSFFSF
jgi:hypothetical protein